ncbi:MAG: hypothetical protein CMN78_04325 [Spirochaetales bacterium]|nr:hypothetical protein [Spirochaetales bacterium]
MKIGEDVRMSLRSIQKRPVESLLLVLGIALGIGATASGISMISHSLTAKRELLSSTQYKEIVVRVRESAADMDLPAVPKINEQSVILTWEDLSAKTDVPDIQYAYLANDFIIRIANFGAILNRTGTRNGGVSQSGQARSTSGSARGPATDGTEASTAGRNSDGGGADGFFQDLPTPDGPAPTVDEIRGKRVSPEYFQAWDLFAAQGSLFTQQEMESQAPYIILGSGLGATLYEDGQPMGREILVFRNLYEVIGVLEPTGTKLDELAYLPAIMPDIDQIPSFARQFVGLNTTLHYTVYDSERLEQAKAQLAAWFSQVYGDGGVVISIPREEVEAAQDRSTRLVSVILFLAIAGLLIASVNVSNILLGRAMRKRKNIGILKALGATVRDVFGLFFIEAFLIGVTGAVGGIGISILISQLMIATLAGGTVISIMLFLGILTSWAITTSLTIIPAMQASRIPAADALRYE